MYTVVYSHTRNSHKIYEETMIVVALFLEIFEGC